MKIYYKINIIKKNAFNKNTMSFNLRKTYGKQNFRNKFISLLILNKLFFNTNLFLDEETIKHTTKFK